MHIVLKTTVYKLWKCIQGKRVYDKPTNSQQTMDEMHGIYCIRNKNFFYLYSNYNTYCFLECRVYIYVAFIILFVVPSISIIPDGIIINSPSGLNDKRR